MLVYRFRLVLEENEEIIRDYEIKSNQTFQDFHNIIQTSLGFEDNQLASFYICDHRWVRQKEITLLDMSENDNQKSMLALPIMKNTLISDYIEEPRQKILYIYDFINLWTFKIELIKILKAEKGVKYPSCSKAVGVLPPKHTPVIRNVNEFDELFNEEASEDSGEDFDESSYNVFEGDDDLGLEKTPDEFDS